MHNLGLDIDYMPYIETMFQYVWKVVLWAASVKLHAAGKSVLSGWSEVYGFFFS